MNIFNTLYVYYRFIEISVRSQMQYRLSFLMLTFSHFLVTGIEFLGIWILFERFGSLRGWSLAEVALMYGIVSIAFSITDAVMRGFDMFGNMVKAGDFDRLLVRPRSTVLQLMGQELTLRRIGRFAQGFAVLIWAASTLNVDWSVAKVGLLFFAVFGGAALFAGLIVLQATLSFWSTESLEIMNTVTYGGVEATQYPVVVYREWFRNIFIYVVPLASASYFPVVAIIGRTDAMGTSTLFQYLSPLIGFAFFIACLQVWKFGVRHYRSTGS